ncbi:uncharacterized protein PRCAT00002881001 [Priceomyces carsonii]|uniref:uncharacterized protein n=1 Tax=Priceomyces carsonii TaxID=28549 RepID=UPI002ED7A022|nr:unnamed protein product [Priceomyces carsonii]
MPYSFDDVTPVELNEEEPQLCRILYDDEYKETMGILLALMEKKEYSERALYITEKGIELLASHYTIWNYRYNILRHLHNDLLEELDWCEQIALDNEKNYQIWNYRQLIISQIDNFPPHREYPIINAMLDLDSKNHHVWSHRKWLVETFGLHEDPKEITFVNSCIDEDVMNNSAWSHRFYIKFSKTDSHVEEEILYTRDQIERCPQNPSSWNYLLGIYRVFGMDISELELFCLQFANISNMGVTEIIRSSFALEALANIYETKDKNKSAAIYDLLALTYDPIRENYWNYKKSILSS